ncbi:TrbI/VirB10 family protein [Acinetobacter sp. HZNU-JH01]|uniref:TrbI/VirB10 family protein n=1 Tax=Acinetobacter sp. HZNU-JH01 TaxID=3136280 RepID=UPI0030F3A822
MSDDIELNPNEKRKKQQTTILVIGGVLLLVAIIGSLFFLGEAPQEQSPQAKSEQVQLTPPGGVDDNAALRSGLSQELATTNERLSGLETQLNNRDQEITGLKDELNEVSSRAKEAERLANEASRAPRTIASPTNTNPPTNTSSAFGSIPPNRQGLHGNSILSDPMGTTVDPATGQVIPLPNNENVAAAKGFGIIDLTQGDTNQTSNTVASTQPKANSTFISDGSFVRVVMVTGIDAPTGGQAQSDPLPVLFETVGKLDMPNNYKVNIKGCRFLGYAWGSLSTERVNARIESGSCIVNGKSVQVNVKGVLVGEDGKPGIRGKVVSKQGQALSAAALASALEAIGGLYSNTQGTTTMGALGVQRTVSGQDLKNSAVGGAISGAAEKLSDFYLRRAEELFPIVEVHAGRAVEILVTKGAEVEGLKLHGSAGSNRNKRTLLDD